MRRHGESGSDFDAAELLVAESVGNAVRHTAGPVWVSLTWRGLNPTMSVYDPPSRRSAALPVLEESLPGGGFGKEAFLRASVVPLAQTIEIQHGQDTGTLTVRMPSSVVAGIVARNSDHGASVLLEERTAVGDPGCRVIVDLNVPKAAAAPEAHHDASPSRDRLGSQHAGVYGQSNGCDT